MNKTVLILIALVCLSACQATDLRAQTIRLAAEPGWDTFAPSREQGGYRYGPSIVINPDGSIEMWCSSPGGKGSDGVHQWDWIRYRRSQDGGKTWTPEQIVLKPTEHTRDRLSVCDPGVVRFGGYYYLGVTSVEDPGGKQNEIFVARSKSPTGPFEKWNGSGWGGKPMPMIEFRSPEGVWGVGEPSFVVLGEKVFIYYTCHSRDEAGKTITPTLVATAPAGDPDWPGKLTLHGPAFARVGGEGSADVKYVDAAGRFLAVSVAGKFSPAAHIIYRQSSDGLHFGEPVRLDGAVMPRCHNVGLSGTAQGHLDLGAANLIAYAYSKEAKSRWGQWHQHLNPLKVLIECDAASQPAEQEGE